MIIIHLLFVGNISIIISMSRVLAITFSTLMEDKLVTVHKTFYKNR